MNKEKMLEWADVLESKKYEQHQGGWGCLNIGELCCLTVALVHFTGREEIMGNSALQERCANIFDVDDDDSTSFCAPFIKMNDEEGLSFPQIAVKIRHMVDTNT